MSDKEKALDALQVIINLTACHTMSKVNDEVIAQSETIKKALNKLPEQSLVEERVSCFYSGMTCHSVPVSEAKKEYKPGDQMCQSCGRCL